MNYRKLFAILASVIIAITCAWPSVWADGTAGPAGGGASGVQRSGERMPTLDGAISWLNSPPLTSAQLRGKVVLVDFWTYSCINCIRTIPYVRAWADKYRDSGLVVVGVHSPEFDFEKDVGNVKAAVDRFKVDFPVAVDSEHRIWNAFGNRYWPAWYLIDADGRVRHRQYGEGGYDKAERAIQSLLAEARHGKPPRDLVAPKASAEQAAPDLGHLQSGETYIGYAQAANFRSRENVRQDAPRRYTTGELGQNEWALAGDWTVTRDRATLNEAGGGIAYRFNARDLHLVLGPGAGGKPVRFQVKIDGRAPGPDHGADVDAEGNGVVRQTRLYQLVRQAADVRERTFEIRFLGTGAEAFAFTFG